MPRLAPHAAILPAGLVYKWDGPVPLIPIFDAPSVGLRPIAKRIAFELSGRCAAGKAKRGGSVETLVTLRDMYEWIWPDDARPWRRARKGRRTADWLLGEVRTLAFTPGNGEPRFCVAPGIGAHDGAPDTPLAVEVRYPAWDSGGGARIDLRPLRRIPLHAQAQYEAIIRLAYVWDRYPAHARRRRMRRNAVGELVDKSGNVIRHTRGKWKGRPVTGNRHARAVDIGEYERNPAIERLPMFGPDEWARMVYGNRPPTAITATRRRLLDHARRALGRMVDAGLVEVEYNGRKRDLWAVRVMRPRPARVQPEGPNVQPEGPNVQPEGSKHSQGTDKANSSSVSQCPSIPEGLLDRGKDATRPDANAGHLRFPDGVSKPPRHRPPLAADYLARLRVGPVKGRALQKTDQTLDQGGGSGAGSSGNRSTVIQPLPGITNRKPMSPNTPSLKEAICDSALPLQAATAMSRNTSRSIE